MCRVILPTLTHSVVGDVIALTASVYWQCIFVVVVVCFVLFKKKKKENCFDCF